MTSTTAKTRRPMAAFSQIELLHVNTILGRAKKAAARAGQAFDSLESFKCLARARYVADVDFEGMAGRPDEELLATLREAVEYFREDG